MWYYNRDQFGRPTIFVPQYLKTLDEKDLSELAWSVITDQRRRARERVKNETDRLRAEHEARRKAKRLQQQQQQQTSSCESLHKIMWGNWPASRVESDLAAGADINATDVDVWRFGHQGTDSTFSNIKHQHDQSSVIIKYQEKY